ncbi:unnamed protein product, partial [Amoebophrya sp. A25]
MDEGTSSGTNVTPNYADTSSRMKTTTTISCRLMMVAWLLTFLPPFIAVIFFPVRMLLDWDAVVVGMCKDGVTYALLSSGAGSSLMQDQMLLLSEEAPSGDFSNFVTTVTTSTGGPSSSSTTVELNGQAIASWCEAKGAGWNEQFFQTFATCAKAAEASCQRNTCDNSLVTDVISAIVPNATLSLQLESKVNLACLSSCANFVAG